MPLSSVVQLHALVHALHLRPLQNYAYSAKPATTASESAIERMTVADSGLSKGEGELAPQQGPGAEPLLGH